MVYIVMGTPGAGKSSIIREFLKRHPDMASKVVNFGTIMFELGRKEYGVEMRDALRTLDRDRFRALQAQAANALLSKGNDIIIDSHASIKTRDGYQPGFPYYVLSKLSVDALVYIRAPLEAIVERRRRDKTRERDIESLDDVRFHESINLAFACAYSNHANAPIKFIINEEGKLGEAVSKFERYVVR